MILRPNEPSLTVDDFSAGLQRASQGVMFVILGDRAEEMSTGFVLAPRIIIAGALPLDKPLPFGHAHVEGAPEGAPIVARFDPVRSALESTSLAPVLLEAQEDMPAVPLELSLNSVAAGDLVYLLYYPEAHRKQRIEVGRVESVGASKIYHDLNTRPGSGGAPLFDARWRLIGMHFGSNTALRQNWGIPCSVLLASLRGTSAWPEIAKYHRLADVDAAFDAFAGKKSPPPKPPLPRALVDAALRWDFDPKSLSSEERAQIEPLVVDAAAESWTLKSNERIRVLRAAKASGLPLEPREEKSPDDPQKLINLALRGGPFDWPSFTEDGLTNLLQIVRWFEKIVPSLPTVADVSRALQRLRIRSRLDVIAGPRFKGRKKELGELGDWYGKTEAGPLLVTGIGGMGKSALVAKFASGLPHETLLFWLDFDRADLSPDDAVSVLEAICDQAVAQIDGFETPDIEEATWHEAAKTIGKRLFEAAAKNPSAPLLVLDSFEAAQYIERYQELWPVLEEICGAIPSLRVLVTGRVDVPGLSLRGREAQRKRLEGLERADAKEWLVDRGIKDEAVLEKVLDLAGGMPLILQLAERLAGKGGEVLDLPQNLPPKVVEAVLYQRILGRLKDPAIAKIARAALVLRRLTVDMVRPVLGGLVELVEDDPAKTIAALGSEMALVEKGDVLRLRADLRSAVLWLVQRDDADFVREIDKRAEAWYAAADLKNPVMAAELVYHRLRLGDLEGAKAAWLDTCASFLQDALDEVPEAGRVFLAARVSSGPTSLPLDSAWELDARKRIFDIASRGFDGKIHGILNERDARSAESPLVFFDAWCLADREDYARAGALLDEKGYPEGPIGRDRAVLRAFIAARSGDPYLADEYLDKIDAPAAWENMAGGAAFALATRAARIHLTLDIEAELELLKVVRRDGRALEILEKILSPADVVLPALQDRLSPSRSTEALRSVTKLEADPASVPTQVKRFRGYRVDCMRSPVAPPEDVIAGVHRSFPDEALARAYANQRSIPEDPDFAKLGLSIALRGMRRIDLATASTFLSETEIWLAQEPSASSYLSAPLLAMLSLFVVLFRTILIEGRYGPLEENVMRWFFRYEMHRVPAQQCALAARALGEGAEGVGKDVLGLLHHVAGDGWKSSLIRKTVREIPSELRPLAILLLTPDPLECLIDELKNAPPA